MPVGSSAGALRIDDMESVRHHSPPVGRPGARPGNRRISPPMTPSPESPLPLAGFRVLDFTRVLAGPLCTMLLGDMGAEVIKIEDPAHGDDTRGWAPFVGATSTYFASVNRNKKSVAVDIKSPDGMA